MMNTLLSLTIYPLWLQNLLYSIGRQSCSWTSLVCSCTSILKQPVASFTSNLTVHLYNLLNFPINRLQLPRTLLLVPLSKLSNLAMSHLLSYLFQWLKISIEHKLLSLTTTHTTQLYNLILAPPLLSPLLDHESRT